MPQHCTTLSPDTYPLLFTRYQIQTPVLCTILSSLCSGKIFIVCDYLDILDITAAVSVIVLTSAQFVLDLPQTSNMRTLNIEENVYPLSMHPKHQLVIFRWQC